MTPELIATIVIQVITFAVVVGMAKQTQMFHAERLKEHDVEIERLERDKLSIREHSLEMNRINTDIGRVEHRVRNIDQRVYGIETKR